MSTTAASDDCGVDVASGVDATSAASTCASSSAAAADNDASSSTRSGVAGLASTATT